MMIFKHRSIGEKKRRIVLAVMATALLAVISITFTGSKFSSLAAILRFGTNVAARGTVRVVGAPATPTPTPAPSGTSVTYIPGSSLKLEQVIGDCDWQYLDYSSGKGTCQPTASRTGTRFNILGNDIGATFEDNGKMLYLSGDTISTNENTVKYHAKDPIAFSTTTDGEAPLFLTYYTQSDGSPLFIEPPGIATGADDVGNSGISLPDGLYIVYNTGADESLADPHQNASSVLVRFDEATKTFTAGRTISKLPGGHFIFTALHASGSDVYMFGVGNYRASDIFLSKTPASSFSAGTGTQYFAGFVNGQPTWTSSESGAVPVVQDNPLNGPAWPNNNPTVANESVAYSSDLNLWLMTYDGGRQSQATKGVYFTYAAAPWGPWATPRLIFNDRRDPGLGIFIHDPSITPDPPGDGLNGPVIGSNDLDTTQGATYAPLMMERFTKVSGNTLKIYYVMSTWNPYTVVKMRSEFAITGPGANPIDQADFFVPEHYSDFLNRAPDAGGLAFWTNEISSCGSNQSCIDVKRVNVSAAFFLSIEFQNTGYLVYRIYKSAYGNIPGGPVPVRFNQFLPDTQEIGQGVIVNQGNWQQQLETNKKAFTLEFVQRSRFTSAFATSLNPAQFVDMMFANTGVTPSTTDRTTAINEFHGAATTADVAARSRALRDVAENSILNQQEFNRAFVLMQYFGYLRRNPYDPPEPTLDFQGYTFWLNKLNSFGGNYINAEMVKAFISAGEYRQRFGP